MTDNPMATKKYTTGQTNLKNIAQETDDRETETPLNINNTK